MPNQSAFRTFVSVLAGALALLVGAAILIGLKVRADYYARVTVEEAVKYSHLILAELNAYHARHAKLPGSLAEISLPNGEPGFVPELVFEASAGVLGVKATSEHGAYGTFRYLLLANTGAPLQWRCTNVSVDWEQLRRHCPT